MKPNPTEEIPSQQYQSWLGEAERLAALYRQTRDERHLVAFAVHLDGMYARLTQRSEQ